MLSVHLVDGIVLRFHNSDNEQDICFGFDGPWHCHAVDDGIQFSNNEGFYIELNGYLDFIRLLFAETSLSAQNTGKALYVMFIRFIFNILMKAI